MTPIEIIEAYNRGDKMESVPYSSGLKRQDVSSVGVAVALTGGSTYISYGKSDIPWIRIKRETFGFFKAINLMREAKIICRMCRPTHEYRLINSVTRPFGEALEERSTDSPYGWVRLSGYPLDWPDAQDFYEVEE